MLLAGGAAGDFSTLTFDERVAVAEAVVDEAAGRVPIAMGGQTTSTRELVRLAKAAERIGADYLQVSPPFYFEHTEGDFEEHILAAADAADVGLIVYNTFWTSLGLSSAMVERLAEIPNVVSLKWSTPDTGAMAFEQIVSRFSDRFAIIDNQMRYVTSHILGARSIEIHVAQLLAAVGGRPVADARARRVRRGAARDGPGRACRSWRCGPRWSPTPAATATSTSCAWSWSGSTRAAPGRRPATSGRSSATRRARCCSTAGFPGSWPDGTAAATATAARQRSLVDRWSNASRRPSPTKFTASTISTISDGGRHPLPGVALEDRDDPRLLDEVAPARRRRLHAQAEVAEAGLEDDHGGDPERREDDQRRDDVGQDVGA